mmetsp:Transcript_23132/g.64261  ORF Transcript_23132/g.64261 Transcript_23132/m.64261 type:complete len:157 (-) Transcript_23132:1087-1557(-)
MASTNTSSMARERGVREGILSPSACKELCFILNSIAVQGNRPGVQSATIHDISHAQPEFLVPLVSAREAVQSCVECMFARELELFPEFTALMAWGPGSAIGWHFDSNRSVEPAQPCFAKHRAPCMIFSAKANAPWSPQCPYECLWEDFSVQGLARK